MHKYILILFFLLLNAFKGISRLHDSYRGKAFKNSSLRHILIDPIVTSDSATCIIPFSRAGNLILLKGKADTTEGNFILDTGAPGLVLNLTYFRNYTANVVEGETGGVTGSAAALQTVADLFTLEGVKYYKVEAGLVNLGHIENSRGVKILGLLGMQLFKNFEMIIDYEKSVLYLHLITKRDKDYQNEILRDTSAYRVHPIEMFENKIITYLYNAGKKLRFIIDTGAESNVLDSRLPNKILDNVVVTRRVMLSGSGNKKVEALYGDLKNTRMGSEIFASLPVLVTNLEKMCTSYNTCLNGMLGFDFLSLHKIGFNFVTNKMYIWK